MSTPFGKRGWYRDEWHCEGEWGVGQDQHATAGVTALSCRSLLLAGENPFPVVLHRDDDPAAFLGLVQQGLGEGAHLAGGQAGGGSVGVLALAIVVQDEHA